MATATATATVTFKAPDMKDALQACNMTEKEYEEVLSVNKGWPHAGKDDAWPKAHDALRRNMRDCAEALASIVERLQAGTPAQAWEVEHLQKWWPLFEKIVHHHHDNEEKIAFPELAKLVELPPKMSADHVTLLASMEEVGKLIANLKVSPSAADDLAAFTELRDKFDAMRKCMEEHLLEEDVIGLPLLRKHMTYNDFKPVEAKILATLTPDDMGWFLHAFPSDEARKAWMTNIAHIPGFVQWLIMKPAVVRYNKNVVRLMQEVKAGSKTEQKKKSLFSCFAA